MKGKKLKNGECVNKKQRKKKRKRKKKKGSGGGGGGGGGGGSRCEPGYSPCLPIVGDLDCDDVFGEQHPGHGQRSLQA